MRNLALAFGICLLLSGDARAQASGCSSCLLGVYDNPEMTRTTGSVSAWVPKTVYLGIHLEASLSGQSLRFEASYPPGFNVLEAVSYIPNAKLEPSDSGGVQVVWPHCVAGTQLLFRIRAITFGRVRDGVVQIHAAELRSCANPEAPPLSIPGSCYILNPSGAAAGCSTASRPSCWGAVKGLFR